ncbi:MAG: VCBS repeat-containing protein, partial [Saprospiraceae bacterium]|nr:VCBS repeat-containing protein [Saprospiraceae bacterium]
ILVTWPDGMISREKNIKADQRIELQQRKAISPDRKPPAATATLMQSLPDFPLSYQHKENDFVDFDRDRLIFHMISAEGPRMSVGDVNNDLLIDLFLGGASGQPGSLFIQASDGSFRSTNEKLLEEDRQSEDEEAVFFDADGDGDADLLVVSGGNEFMRGHMALADRLYLNDGNGGFSRKSDAFGKEVFESGSCVAPADFDGDGDIDLFIGTRLLPAVYGIPVSGYLWANDGQGNFEDVSDKVAPGLKQIGLITDAEWKDLDGDGLLDLVVVGEWMPVSIFRNDGRHLALSTDSGLQDAKGLWNCIRIADMDSDGKPDLVLGNHGLNTRLKASYEKPITLYINDFDNNRTPEQIITMYNGEQAYPLTRRTDLVMQMPVLKKKYLYFSDYEEQTIDEILDEKALKTAAKVEVTNTASSIAWNQGNGRFSLESLPTEAQFAPVYALLIGDFDADHRPDILLGGNFYRSKPEIGMYDASYGLVLKGQESRGFLPLSSQQSGINVQGEVRDLQSISWRNNQIILIARNNDSLVALKIIEGPPLQ